ncbi:hypothetical protein P7L95_00245 [Bisgaard Taxon 10/6]|uniref:hypothetical protein n=1 Tax=Exercitatus varius TaxID=67857 RepID=UPI00294B409A|nr:hypothetical protein [Exercitatus varius]MDG2955191.1 hypothetical protein [Exercitatus varius]MDG2963473.1 hypothetical protein [Exercitatus varius]
MSPELSSVSERMLRLGLAALSHANSHANYFSFENNMWAELSVLQVAHAMEILIKAKIAEEHPLLIFESLPKSSQVDNLNYQSLCSKAKTLQYSDLPERLWATTGITIEKIDLYKEFGVLRNSIQHFADPNNINCGDMSRRYIYEIIDPFINSCWNLYAVDYNEDTEPYTYLLEILIENEIEFLIPPKIVGIYIDEVSFSNSSIAYKKEMIRRLNISKLVQ